ncbi:hypothetical protein J6590_069911 [Homalodisca vitripennis]|nr:hypothetical protein J6590_069911 [Homalodisca vitripennis]
MVTRRGYKNTVVKSIPHLRETCHVTTTYSEWENTDREEVTECTALDNFDSRTATATEGREMFSSTTF